MKPSLWKPRQRWKDSIKTDRTFRLCLYVFDSTNLQLYNWNLQVFHCQSFDISCLPAIRLLLEPHFSVTSKRRLARDNSYRLLNLIVLTCCSSLAVIIYLFWLLKLERKWNVYSRNPSNWYHNSRHIPLLHMQKWQSVMVALYLRSPICLHQPHL
jgi:hypothetical protein